MACTHCDHCELYAQFALNPALQIWQIHYCQADFSRCVRFQMSLRRETVPLNMLPNGTRVDLPRSTNDYTATALFNAILKQRIPMLESMLKSGIDVNVRNSEDMTPLMAAASSGSLKIISILLARGADPHAINAYGEDAAAIATRQGHADAARLLMTAKAGSARPGPATNKSSASRKSGGLFGFLRRG